MLVESTQEFIDRKKKSDWTDQNQLASMIKVYDYCNSEVLGLPGSTSSVSDGESYGILWKDEGQSLNIDVFDWSGEVRICWMYYNKNEEELITWLDFSKDIEPDTIPSEKLIFNLKKLIKS